jgi:hypothetical protein
MDSYQQSVVDPSSHSSPEMYATGIPPGISTHQTTPTISPPGSADSRGPTQTVPAACLACVSHQSCNQVSYQMKSVIALTLRLTHSREPSTSNATGLIHARAAYPPLQSVSMLLLVVVTRGRERILRPTQINDMLQIRRPPPAVIAAPCCWVPMLAHQFPH